MVTCAFLEDWRAGAKPQTSNEVVDKRPGCVGWICAHRLRYMSIDPSHQFDMLDGSDLRLLVELERQGSINQAARSCGFGQPAASKRLQRIAKTVGFEVVETDGTGTRLTAEGRKIASHGRRVLASVERLHRDLA